MKQGWQKQRLSSISSKITDGSHNPPKGVAESDYLMLSSKNVFDDDLHYEAPRYLTAEQFQQEDKRTGIVPDDVLLTIVGTVGRSAIVPFDAPQITLQRSVAVIRPQRRVIEPRFLMYSFIERNEELNARARGVAQKGIYLETLRELDVEFPPLPDQKRIVGILDDAYSGIATAKANAERNLQNARALFESHLYSVFTRRGLGWIEKRLEQIGRTQTGSTPKTSERDNYGDFIPFIKPADFNTDGSLDYENDGLTEKGLSEAREVAAGSVLMVCIGATIGKCGYCEREITTNQQINALTPTDGSAHRFIYYQMLSEDFQRRVIHGSGQATLPIINKSKWSALSVWLPPKATEQKRIAAEFDALVAETHRLASLCERKLVKLDGLKKSLLHQAFTGNL